MMFGEWGTKDHDVSIQIIHRALDAGITFVDTADVYSAGESEVIVGKALAGRRACGRGYGRPPPVIVYRSKMPRWFLTCGFIEWFTQPGGTR
jgi:diketogulonate reductase-like aldo/keto reductase